MNGYMLGWISPGRAGPLEGGAQQTARTWLPRAAGATGRLRIAPLLSSQPSHRAANGCGTTTSAGIGCHAGRGTSGGVTLQYVVLWANVRNGQSGRQVRGRASTLSKLAP